MIKRVHCFLRVREYETCRTSAFRSHVEIVTDPKRFLMYMHLITSIIHTITLKLYIDGDMNPKCPKIIAITVIYPVSNLIQFRIKWSYRHELHSSCSIKKQIFCMVMKSIFFSSSAQSQILKTYLHAKNKSVLRDDLSN